MAVLLMIIYSFGQLAQSVEQRTENPRVPGSIPGLATIYTALWPSGKA